MSCGIFPTPPIAPIPPGAESLVSRGNFPTPSIAPIPPGAEILACKGISATPSIGMRSLKDCGKACGFSGILFHKIPYMPIITYEYEKFNYIL
ncbi:MAG: hypothetical protein IJC78_01110 [Clostridia bacterium]|nr:hypothetical protein [Clostridia bacterium]